MFIYLIQNKINGKVYVGQTIRAVRYRWNRHRWESENGSSQAIHRAFKKYGSENFEISVIDRAECRDELNVLEKQYIAQYNSISPNGYNLEEGGGCGPVHPESRAKMSQTHKGRPLSDRHKANIGNGLRGLKRSAEDKRNKSLALKGRKPSEQCIQAARKYSLGRKATPEQLAKMVLAFAGEKNPAFRHDVSNEKIAELLAAGHGPHEIAATMMAPYLMVYRRCKKMGYLSA